MSSAQETTKLRITSVVMASACLRLGILQSPSPETARLSAPPTATRSPLPVPGRDGALDPRHCDQPMPVTSTTLPADRSRTIEDKTQASVAASIPPRNGAGTGRGDREAVGGAAGHEAQI